MRSYVIIGSGIAGLSAAEAIRAHDGSASLTLITDDKAGYYSRPGLAYYLLGDLPENQLYPFRSTDYRRLNIRWICSRVESIDLTHHCLYLAIGTPVGYDRLLVATGASAVRPEVPGSALDGVLKLDNLEDARLILKMIRRGAPAIVVGGGITALELAEGLAARGMDTHYLLRGERYWSNVLDEVESDIVERRLEEDGIRLHHHTQVAEIIGRGNRVAGVRTQQGQVIPCSVFAYAIGIRPRKDLAGKSGLATEKGIIANPSLQTSDPDVFAAGDVAQVVDPSSGESVLESLWLPAAQQGRIAGANMAGAGKTYLRGMPFNVTRLAGLITTLIGQVGNEVSRPARDLDVTGISRGESETWRKTPDAELAQTYRGDNRLRIYLSQQHLVGAVVMGEQTLSRPLQYLIREGIDISTLRPMLLQPGAPLEELLLQFWEEFRGEHAPEIA